MSRLVVLIALLAFVFVDSLPLSGTKDSLVDVVKRDADPANNSSNLAQGNSSISCNSTGNCSLSITAVNITDNSSNVTEIHLNLTEACSQNATGDGLECNGTTVNFTRHCEGGSSGNITLYCADVTNNKSSIRGNSSINGTVNTPNGTLTNATNVNTTAPNATTVNATTVNATTVNATTVNATTVNGTIGVAATISPSRTVDASVSSTVTASSSLVEMIASSSHYESSSSGSTSTNIQPSATLSTVTASSSVAAVTEPVIPRSTTSQSTTAQSTTAQATTPQSTTPQSSTPQPTTPQPTTPQPTTPQPTTPQPTTPQSTTTTVTDETEAEKTTKTVSTTMESPYYNAKNVKFFYVNVLIPIGAGVCGALLIAFSVLLFKCCRRRKLKKVRYFGKHPRRGYSKSGTDHMNLLAASSDEE